MQSSYLVIICLLYTSSSLAESMKVPLDDDMNYDLDAMLAAITDKTKILVVVNPNNPTGTCLLYTSRCV